MRETGPALQSSVAWQVGYTGDTGDRHLFFEAPGIALFPVQLDESADSFLNGTSLLPGSEPNTAPASRCRAA
jgi:hypothetical protein